MPRPPDADRILVIRLGAIGDVVRTIPAVRSLRVAYPRARIGWLVERAASGILDGQSWLDDVIVFPRERISGSLRALDAPAISRELAEVVRTLRAERFDLVLDFHGILKSGLLGLATGAPLRVGYARPFGRELSPWLANRRARLAGSPMSRFERNEGLVRFLSIDAEPPAGPLLELPDSSRSRLAEPLSELGPFAVIHPGSSPATPYKRWSAVSFGRVAAHLRDRHRITSLVTFGQDERGLAAAVVSESAEAARLAPATDSLSELAALFERARLFVGGDSGPLHLASLVGTPVVQILGPTHPVENAPWSGTPARSVRVAVPCSPCRRGCARASCMAAVTPSGVCAAVDELLADSPRRSTDLAASPPIGV